jgi:hypothetical protein
MWAGIAASAEVLPAATVAPSVTDRASPLGAAMAVIEPSAEGETDPSKLPVLPALQQAQEGSETLDDPASPLPAPATTAPSPPPPSPPAHLLEEVAEIELIRTLLALYAAEDQPDVANLAFEALVAAKTEETETRIRPSPTSLPSDGGTDEPDAPSNDRPVHLEERLALTNSIPPSDHRELGRSRTHGEGLPLAFVNYVIEDDDERSPIKRARKDAEDDAEPDEAAEEDSKDASGDEPSRGDPGESSEMSGPDVDADGADGQPNLDPATSSLGAADVAALPSPDTDTAQALYLRLSDFA